MVVGTSEGFTKDLQLIGVGYRAAVNGKKLNMNLGFSHPVEMEIPGDVEVKVSCLHCDVLMTGKCLSFVIFILQKMWQGLGSASGDCSF